MAMLPKSSLLPRSLKIRSSRGSTSKPPGGSLKGRSLSEDAHEDWYGPEGELRKFLVGLEVIVGPAGDLEDAEFSANRFLDEDRDKLLNSRLIEASAVEYIIASADPVDGDLRGTLYLPADLQTNNGVSPAAAGGSLLSHKDHRQRRRL